jgi:hypothetical protein
MVLVHVKQSEERQFLHEFPASQSVDLLLRELVVLHNLQLRLLVLAAEGQQLCLYGPSRLVGVSGEDSDDDDDDEGEDGQERGGECSSSSNNKNNNNNPRRPHGPFYLKDPAGKRTGEGEFVSSDCFLESLSDICLPASLDVCSHTNVCLYAYAQMS